MEIMFLNPSKSIQGNSLFQIINLYKNSEDYVNVYETLEMFIKNLKEIKDKEKIAIIYTPKNEDLLELYSYKHYLYKVITILILPEDSRDIIALGLRCNPFFMITNFKDIKKIGSIIRILSSKDPNFKNLLLRQLNMSKLCGIGNLMPWCTRRLS